MEWQCCIESWCFQGVYGFSVYRGACNYVFTCKIECKMFTNGKYSTLLLLCVFTFLNTCLVINCKSLIILLFFPFIRRLTDLMHVSRTCLFNWLIVFFRITLSTWQIYTHTELICVFPLLTSENLFNKILWLALQGKWWNNGFHLHL